MVGRAVASLQCEVGRLNHNTHVSKGKQVGPLGGHVIAPSLVVPTFNISIVKDVEHIAPKQTRVARESTEQRRSRVLASTVGTLIHKCLHVEVSYVRVAVLKVKVVQFDSLGDSELVLRVLRVAGVLVDGGQDFLEVVLHVGLQEHDLVLDRVEHV